MLSFIGFFCSCNIAVPFASYVSPLRQSLFARSSASFTPPPGAGDLTDLSRLNECRATCEEGRGL